MINQVDNPSINTFGPGYPRAIITLALITAYCQVNYPSPDDTFSSRLHNISKCYLSIKTFLFNLPHWIEQRFRNLEPKVPFQTSSTSRLSPNRRKRYLSGRGLSASRKRMISCCSCSVSLGIRTYQFPSLNIGITDASSGALWLSLHPTGFNHKNFFSEPKG